MNIERRVFIVIFPRSYCIFVEVLACFLTATYQHILLH